MNVPTITMPQIEAKQALDAYRKGLQIAGNSTAAYRRNEENDRALMEAYQALAAGRRILDLHEVMQEAGCDDQGRPRLAICPAHVRWCYFNLQWLQRNQGSFGNNRRCGVFATTRAMLYRPSATRSRVEVPVGCFPGIKRLGWGSLYRAMVPSIPPQYRPVHSRHGERRYTDLKRYHILWEADWEEVPHDPMLLKHLSGALYVVLAKWDLTELEQAVLKKYL